MSKNNHKPGQTLKSFEYIILLEIELNKCKNRNLRIEEII